MLCKSNKQFAEKVLFAKGLGTLTKVKSLCLSGPGITDVGLDPLWALTQLETLTFHNTKITDEGGICLEGLLNLITLNLSEAMITTTVLEHLKGLPNLKNLDLSGCPGIDHWLCDSPEYDSGFANLETLNISLSYLYEDKFKMNEDENTFWFSKPDRTPRPDLPGIWGTGLSAIMDGLPNLKVLHLASAHITDFDLGYLEASSNMKWITLDGCVQVTEAGQMRLEEAMPDCTIGYRYLDEV